MPAHLSPCPLGLLSRVMAPQEALSQVVGTTLLSPSSQNGEPT